MYFALHSFATANIVIFFDIITISGAFCGFFRFLPVDALDEVVSGDYSEFSRAAEVGYAVVPSPEAELDVSAVVVCLAEVGLDCYCL